MRILLARGRSSRRCLPCTAARNLGLTCGVRWQVQSLCLHTSADQPVIIVGLPDVCSSPHPQVPKSQMVPGTLKYVCACSQSHTSARARAADLFAFQHSGAYATISWHDGIELSPECRPSRLPTATPLVRTSAGAPTRMLARRRPVTLLPAGTSRSAQGERGRAARQRVGRSRGCAQRRDAGRRRVDRV